MKPRRARVKARRHEEILGTCPRGTRVGYAGTGFTPPPEAYRTIDVATLNYTSVADSGSQPGFGRGLAGIVPLIAAAMYEAAFAGEAGPLTTWSN